LLSTVQGLGMALYDLRSKKMRETNAHLGDLCF
jgi:hypothetical protein